MMADNGNGGTVTNNTCTGPDCQKKAKGHGLCVGHLAQKKKGRELAPLEARAKGSLTCTGPECSRRAYVTTGGLCLTHSRQKEAGEPLTSLKCAVDECTRESASQGWCKKHYQNYKNHGTPIAPARPVAKPKVSRNRPTRLELFWNKVEKQENACWLWTGGMNPTTGYGSFYVGKSEDGKRLHMAPHRWIYLQTHPFTGEPPQHVRHTCDTPLCVNYESHLVGGSAKENFEDRDRKRRGGHEGGVYRKLTFEEAQEIRAQSPKLSELPALAERYNVHPRTLYMLVKGKTYRTPDKRSHERKLTEEQVRQMRADYESGNKRLADLVKESGLTLNPVLQMLRRETYKDVA